MNPAKTEFMIIGSEVMLRKCPPIDEITIDGIKIQRSNSLRLLGVYIDCNLKMDKFVTNTCKSTYAYVKTLSKLRSSLTQSSMTHAFIVSKIDYCVILLNGTQVSVCNRLQRALNAAVRMLCGLHRREDLSFTYKSLQWLSLHNASSSELASLCSKQSMELSQFIFKNF